MTDETNPHQSEQQGSAESSETDQKDQRFDEEVITPDDGLSNLKGPITSDVLISAYFPIQKNQLSSRVRLWWYREAGQFNKY